MRIYRLYGAMDIRREDAPTPVPAPDEVLIRTAYVGICGSDMPRILKGNDVPFFPSTIGHEFSAIVTQVGSDVRGLQPGDRVVVAPRLVCGSCIHCKNGNAGQCIDGRFLGLGVPDVGGFAEYNALPQKNLIKLPPEMSLVEAAMIEPITVGLHALSLMHYTPERPVAVIGTGTIGMLAIQCMHAFGAQTIYAFDMDDRKLALAAQFGATYCYNTRDDNFFDRFMDDTEGYGAPQVLEAVGGEKTILLALEVGAVMADIAIIGDVLEAVTIPAFNFKRRISYRQLHLHGVYQSYTDGFPGIEFNRAVQLINKGKLNLKPLIYSVDSIDNFQRYFEKAKTPGAINGKMIFSF